jgi:hypothetical protein
MKWRAFEAALDFFGDLVFWGTTAALVVLALVSIIFS